MDRPYRRPRKQAVSLTSLLDLLFVMIFVSLLQQKTAPTKAEPKKVVSKPKVVEAKKDTPKPKKPAPPVKVVHSIRATFNFYGTNSNPSIPNGSFLMSGQYNSKDGRLELGGMAWITRPKNYDMVPLSGTIDPKTGVFKGRVEFIGCKEFTLKRKIQEKGSPISGEWVGSYDCSQGETGLTLTIQ